MRSPVNGLLQQLRADAQLVHALAALEEHGAVERLADDGAAVRAVVAAAAHAARTHTSACRARVIQASMSWRAPDGVQLGHLRLQLGHAAVQHQRRHVRLRLLARVAQRRVGARHRNHQRAAHLRTRSGLLSTRLSKHAKDAPSTGQICRTR